MCRLYRLKLSELIRAGRQRTIDDKPPKGELIHTLSSWSTPAEDSQLPRITLARVVLATHRGGVHAIQD